MLRMAATMVLAALLGITASPEAPATGIWGRAESLGGELFGVDALHSYLGFSVGFLGITKVRGTFNEYSACILYDEKDPTKTSATVVIDPGSISTGFEQRDKDLKDARFFDVAKYPHIVFQTQSVERTGPNRYLVHATLEIKGVRRPVDLPMTQTVQRAPDTAWGNIRIGGSGAVTVKRSDFGILADQFWGKAIGDEVEVSIELLGIRPNHDKWGFGGSKEKPPAGEIVWKAWQAEGLDAALSGWAQLKQTQPNDYDFSARQLSIVGLRLQQRGLFGQALRVYELALATGPKDPSLLESRIAEIHAVQGDRAAAIAGYRKVLAQHPDDAEAIEMLRRLESRERSARGR